MSSEDILQIIPDEKLPELLNILKQDYPQNLHMYYFIDTTIQLKKNRPHENYVTIYVPEGDISDGTFLAEIEMHCYDILIYTQDRSQKRLEKMLRETRRIKWEKDPLFACIDLQYFDTIKRVREETGHPFPFDVASNVWWLPKEKALQYDSSIPDDIYVGPLNEKNAITMNNAWPHKAEGTEKYLAKLIELNGGIGLFLKSNNQLVAWILKNYFGGLGILQTADDHKKKGYGSLVTKIFSKIIAEEDGYDLSGFIVTTNSVSQAMFTKLGFQKSIPITWMINECYKNTNH